MPSPTAPDDEPGAPAPAAFIAPHGTPNRFSEADDRAELDRVRKERRRALDLLHDADRRAWREAP